MKVKILLPILSLVLVGSIVLGYEIYNEKDKKANINKEIVINSDDNVNIQDISNEVTSRQGNLTNNSNETISMEENSENDKSTKDKVKNTTITANNDNIGRIEISALNIKEDLLSSQIKYTTAGLNKIGNSVIYLENIKYEEITKNTEIYIRNDEQEKVIYNVYNIYETSMTDTSFYTSNTNQIELTLAIKISESNILVIQAKKQ